MQIKVIPLWPDWPQLLSWRAPTHVSMVHVPCCTEPVVLATIGQNVPRELDRYSLSRYNKHLIHHKMEQVQHLFIKFWNIFVNLNLLGHEIIWEHGVK